MPNHSRTERARDRTLDDSFPASDPPASSGMTGARRPEKPSHQRHKGERPTGTPTSDRHATETAHHWEDDLRHRADELREDETREDENKPLPKG